MIIGLIAGTSGDSLTIELKKAGYKVALITGKAGEPGESEADFCLTCDLSQHQVIIDYFLELKVDKVIFGTGHYKAINLLPELQRNKITTNLEEKTFNLVKDKIKFKSLIDKAGVLTPRYFTFNTKDEVLGNIENIPFPCVVKSSTDLIQPAKVYSPNRLLELTQVLESRGSGILVEEFINGSDCTVAVSNDGNAISDYGVIYYCKAKEYNLEGFEGANANFLPQLLEEKICTLSKELVSLVGIKGLVRVDYIVQANQIFVLEINAIMVTGYNGSAYPFFEEKNIDIAKIMVDTSLVLIGEH
ncbi:ATP-grasp domain-containing protein [Pseudoalteromonas sp. H105]|uniref:ATP-grasp domain-containing protein n=1 Tax=Pseudoalteromonas sp. H105 TaxID=1348393 RepID=UPI000732236E|nr:ATP-grasp domain-containing protein [Pseudoalteromonas sp. H105]KTF15204.1 hypothetical protein ATS75_10465 [Pseudoalteromonas sp. H105]